MKLQRLKGESDIELIFRVCNLRGTHPQVSNWESVRLVLNELLELSLESTRDYRAFYSILKKLIDTERSKTNETIKQLRQDTVKLTKIKYQNQDVLREYRKHIRDEARIDALLDRLEEISKSLEPIELSTTITPNRSDEELVACISDWHGGAMFENHLGKFNFKVLIDRVSHYGDEIIRYASQHNVKRISVLNLGDMIEGNIHVSARVQAEFDAIDQTLKMSEVVAKFIQRIRNETGIPVQYGYVLDNHSRIYANKKEHIEKESFGKILHELVKLRLKNSDVVFLENQIDDNIGMIEVANRRILYVHGHLESKARVKENLENLLHEKFDLVLLGHYHQIEMKSGSIVNGSLMGTNEYAFNRRLSERPSQTMIAFKGDTQNNIIVYL